MPVEAKTNESRQIARYWNAIASDFDAIYTGRKNFVFRRLDRLLRKDMYQRFDWVMRKADELRPASVCDIGCGSGRFVSPLAQRGARVTGVDFAPEMLNMARALAEHDGVASGCNFVLSDVLGWKTQESFDMVIAIGFWDYVADPLPRLRVIRGLTKHAFLSAWPRAGTLRTALRKARLKAAGCPVYFWTRPQVENYLQQAGFRIESIEKLGQLYCVHAQSV